MRSMGFTGLLVLGMVSAASAQQTRGFTYQGRIKLNGTSINGTADLQFSVYDAAGSGSPPTGGNQVGSTQTISNVAMADGLFTVTVNGAGQISLDLYGSGSRWLQIAVRSPAGSGTYTTLSPRQEIMPVPFAHFAREIPMPYEATGSAFFGPLLIVENTSPNTFKPALQVISTSPTGPSIEAFNQANGTAVFGWASGANSVGVSASAEYMGVSARCGPNGFAVHAEPIYATATAGRFYNTVTDTEVKLVAPAGAITTNGFVYREYTASTPRVAIPIAYGSVAADGSINGGTGNFTVGHGATGEYDITIAGETFTNTAFTGSVTVQTNATPFTATISAISGAMRVHTWNLTTSAKANIAFHFVIYGTNPNAPG